MKVAFMGDTHGNERLVKAYVRGLAERDCHTIIQLGDFGYWPRLEGARFIHEIAEVCEQARSQLWFIDGNHEDHLMLGTGKDLDHTQMKKISREDQPGGVFYLPRGYHFELGATKFFCMGGAGSIDKKYRKVDWSWFHEEEPNNKEINQGLDYAQSQGVDVLLSHDCTTQAFNNFYPNDTLNIGDGTRRALSGIANHLKVDLNIHGHHHISERLQLDVNGHSMLSWGLASDGMPGMCVLVDVHEPVSEWTYKKVDFKC